MSKRNKKQRNPEQDAPSLQAGDRLRIARESRDLSIDDVAARLKLDVGKIRALEQGDIAGFAAPVFAAGYLRAYARLLELAETEVLADFSELASVHEPAIDPPLSVNNGKMVSGVSSQLSLSDKPSGNYLGKAGFVGVFVVGLVYFLWPVSESEHVVGVANLDTNTGLAETTVEIAVPTLAVVREEKVIETQSPVAEYTVETVESEWVLPAMSADPVAVPDAETKAVAIVESSELVLVFNNDSWAEVQDAGGQRLVYRLGKAGTRSVVKGVAPFMVQLGYVQGVDILYNGAEYDLSKYAHRRSVRLRIGVADDRTGDE